MPATEQKDDAFGATDTDGVRYATDDEATTVKEPDPTTASVGKGASKLRLAEYKDLAQQEREALKKARTERQAHLWREKREEVQHMKNLVAKERQKILSHQ